MYRPSLRKLLFNTIMQPAYAIGFVIMLIFSYVMPVIIWVLRLGAIAGAIVDFVYLFNGGQRFGQFILILIGLALAVLLSWGIDLFANWYIDVIEKFDIFIKEWNNKDEDRMIDKRVNKMNKKYDKKQIKKTEKEQKKIQKREKYNARASKRSQKSIKE